MLTAGTSRNITDKNATTAPIPVVMMPNCDSTAPGKPVVLLDELVAQPAFGSMTMVSRTAQPGIHAEEVPRNYPTFLLIRVRVGDSWRRTQMRSTASRNS